MIKMLIRLAPSQAGGKFDSGTLASGVGGTANVATGVPLTKTGPPTPAVTVPHAEGGVPAIGVIVQQVTRLRTKKNPLIARTSMIAQKMICPKESGPNFMFFRELSVFIQVLYIPYPSQVVPNLLLPSASAIPNLHP